MTQDEMERAITQHTLEMRDIRQTLAQFSQQTQESIRQTSLQMQGLGQQMQGLGQQMQGLGQQIQESNRQISLQRQAFDEEMGKFRQDMEAGFAHTRSILDANAEQIAANTAGLIELRGLVADYLSGRSQLIS